MPNYGSSAMSTGFALKWIVRQLTLYSIPVRGLSINLNGNIIVSGDASHPEYHIRDIIENVFNVTTEPLGIVTDLAQSLTSCNRHNCKFAGKILLNRCNIHTFESSVTMPEVIDSHTVISELDTSNKKMASYLAGIVPENIFQEDIKRAAISLCEQGYEHATLHELWDDGNTSWFINCNDDGKSILFHHVD